MNKYVLNIRMFDIPLFIIFLMKRQEIKYFYFDFNKKLNGNI